MTRLRVLDVPHPCILIRYRTLHSARSYTAMLMLGGSSSPVCLNDVGGKQIADASARR
jgi:hypothetical protein